MYVVRSRTGEPRGADSAAADAPDVDGSANDAAEVIEGDKGGAVQ